MSDSNMSARPEAQCSHFSQDRVYPASMRSSEPQRECGTRNLTEPVLSRTYLSLNSTHHATAPVAQWWSDSLVPKRESCRSRVQSPAGAPNTIRLSQADS